MESSKTESAMNIGMVGLGRMGAALARRLKAGNVRVVAYDMIPAVVDTANREGLDGCASLSLLVERLWRPRVVWVMQPDGAPTENAVASLIELLNPDDVIIDGGNSYYKDSIRRSEDAAKRGIHFVDVGTNGGIHGEKNGFCLTVGGDAEIVRRLVPLFRVLSPSPDCGWGHVGSVGSGHFVKMVHIGIEYGMMQSLAEGFSLLGNKSGMGLDLSSIARIWQHGSIIRSWLLDLTADTLSENPRLGGIAPYVPDTGEGRWAVSEAVNQGVPMPVITSALMERFSSRDAEGFSKKLISALRNRFGGHEIKKG
jgi:6-phosphogluconate dehydrogenase